MYRPVRRSETAAEFIPRDMAAMQAMDAAGGRSRSSRMVLAHPNAGQHDNITLSPGYTDPRVGQRSELAGSRQELLSSHWGLPHPHPEEKEPICEDPEHVVPGDASGVPAAGGRSRSSRMVLAHPNAGQHDNITLPPGYTDPRVGQRSELAGSRQELLSSHWGIPHPGSEDMELVDQHQATVGHVASVPFNSRPTPSQPAQGYEAPMPAYEPSPAQIAAPPVPALNTAAAPQGSNASPRSARDLKMRGNQSSFRLG